MSRHCLFLRRKAARVGLGEFDRIEADSVVTIGISFGAIGGAESGVATPPQHPEQSALPFHDTYVQLHFHALPVAAFSAPHAT